MKKYICLLLLLGLAVSLWSCEAGRPASGGGDLTAETQLAPESFCYASAQGTYTCRMEKGAVSIMGFTGDCAQVSIPDFIDGRPVASIEENAFYQQIAIRSLALPQTLETIESSAFYRCYGLEEICIPENVERIGSNPFFRCVSLERIAVDAGNARFTSIDGVLYSKDASILYAYPEGKKEADFALPDSVKRIEDAAFGYFPWNLQTLTIPDSVEKMPAQILFAYPDDKLTLQVAAGSAAEEYARDWDMQYAVIESADGAGDRESAAYPQEAEG